jgi:hypothetical protein
MSQYDVVLPFDVGFGYRLILCFEASGFTLAELADIFRQDKNLNEPIILYIQIATEMIDGQELVNCVRLSNPPTGDYGRSAMSFSAHRGELAKGKLPDLRQIIAAYLYWSPVLPPKSQQDNIRNRIQQCIKDAVDNDDELRADIEVRLARLSTGKTEGDVWYFLD